MLEPRVDPLLAVTREHDAAAGALVALDADALLHGDVDAAHRVDEAPEAAQVDDDRVADVQAGDLADDVDGRLPTGALDPGEQVGATLGEGPDAVHEALVAAVVAVRVERVQRVVPGNGTRSRFRGMPTRSVSPVFVFVLTTMSESVRVPHRVGPASDPMRRVLTRGTSAHGSGASTSASATSGSAAPGPGTPRR